MSTTLLKKETLERKWYVIDAAGKPLGRTAVIAANILRGRWVFRWGSSPPSYPAPIPHLPCVIKP